MSANTILTSVVTAGSNNHTTTAEEANTLATDFVSQGVVGAITLNTGSGGTGSFCVNQNTGSNMAINILAGQAYITATPSSQNSQVLRPRASADYTAYTINSNASGSTKYDWIYLKVDATKANNPASDASDVTSIFTSRSSSNSTDNGSPPTYGLLLGYVTVANGATAITNSNITDKRFNTSIGGQNGSLIVTQSGTGVDAKIQAAGTDANVSVDILPKGAGRVSLNAAGAATAAYVPTGESTTSTSYADLTTTTDTATVTVGNSGQVLFAIYSKISNTTVNSFNSVSFVASGANTIAVSDIYAIRFQAYAANAESRMGATFLLTGLTPGSTTFKLKYKVETGGSGAGTGTFTDRRIAVVPQ